MCIMFLLNMEVCNLTPPFGQNVFVASYRFNRSTVDLYRFSFPFLVVMVLGLVLVDAFPSLSTFSIQADVARERAKAVKLGEAPRVPWSLTCVQNDPNNPRPCTDEEAKRWGVAKSGTEMEEEEKDDFSAFDEEKSADTDAKAGHPE
jgi:hypothetical protein